LHENTTILETAGVPAGVILGQAAWFDTITREDGTTVNLATPPATPPEVIEAAEAAVVEQADKVRRDVSPSCVFEV
jgi:hypothetical protein